MLTNMLSLFLLVVASSLLILVPSKSISSVINCHADPGRNLEDYPVFHFGTTSPLPDPEGNYMFGDSLLRMDKQITRSGESWIVGPVYFRGDQVYHDGRPFAEFILRESRLTCSYESITFKPSVLPNELRTVVAADIRQRLFDPYSIRSVKLGALAGGLIDQDSKIFIACVQFNAKNRMGGYAGLSRFGYVLRADRSLVKLLPQAQTNGLCANTLNEPFPELGPVD